jgi:hypothetical protein
MAHVIEPATSGRAKCRGCDRKIEQGALRFGERQPNAFGEGEMTLWFHLDCAAYKRPEPVLELLGAMHAADSVLTVDDDARLRAMAAFGVAHRRVPRINGGERAATGRARCRHCRELVERGDWRVPLVFFEEYRFAPAGFVHAACAHDYFGTTDVLDRMRHFNPELDEAAAAELALAMNAEPSG